jgi:hypothetical protein
MRKRYTPNTRKSGNGCSKCEKPGFRFRGERWLCVIHHRIDTMQNSARTKRKAVPTTELLDSLASELVGRKMACEVCNVIMQWAGKMGEPHTVSLQHDRSGRFRLICMRCNQIHDDLPGDSFYDLPKNHWRCRPCNRVLPLSSFYKNRAGSCCIECRKKLNKKMWALHGKTWAKNSQRRKRANQDI